MGWSLSFAAPSKAAAKRHLAEKCTAPAAVKDMFASMIDGAEDHAVLVVSGNGHISGQFGGARYSPGNSNATMKVEAITLVAPLEPM